MVAQLFLIEMTRMMFVASSASGSLEYLLASTRQASACSNPTRAKSLGTITEPCCFLFKYGHDLKRLTVISGRRSGEFRKTKPIIVTTLQPSRVNALLLKYFSIKLFKITRILNKLD